MNFGTIDKIIVFGGTQRVINLVNTVHREYEIIIFSSERLLKSYLFIEGMTLERWLIQNQVVFFDIAEIRSFDFDLVLTETTLGISLGAPWIFTSDIIQKFSGRLINGHGAKLPQDRGAGDFSWQIMRGLDFGYHLFHKIDQGIDTGDIIFINEFLFPHSCWTPADFKNYAMAAEKHFFEEFFERVKERFEFQETTQQEYFSTYFPRLSTQEHGFINWNWTAKEIEHFIRAFDDPYPGASTYLKGKRVYFKKVRLTKNDGDFHPFMSGLIYRKTDQILFVAASGAGLIIETVLDENRQNLISNVSLGDRFWTPYEKLDYAMTTRVSYDAKGIVLHHFPIS